VAFCSLLANGLGVRVVWAIPAGFKGGRIEGGRVGVGHNVEALTRKASGRSRPPASLQGDVDREKSGKRRAWSRSVGRQGVGKV
jgi:hypothetical protein